MNYLALLVAALVLGSTGRSTPPFKGYIVTLTGDTEQVFIRPPLGTTDEQRVVVVDSTGKLIRTFGAGELKAYGFDRTIWRLGAPRLVVRRQQYRQFLTPDSLPVLAGIMVLGPKASGFSYQQKKGPFGNTVDILQKGNAQPVYIHFSQGWDEMTGTVTNFFADDPIVSAEIKKTRRNWRSESINLVIAHLLRLYNGQESPWK